MKTYVIAATLAATVALPAAAQEPMPVPVPMAPIAGTLLDVSARGLTTRVPDQATVRAGVVSQAATAAAALADNSARMGRVLARLKRAGVADRDIATASVGLQPQYRYADNQPPAITGYQAINSLSVRFRDVGKAGPVLDALVAEGANQIDGPNFALSQPDAALDEARADAVARARARADLYAKAAGLRVVRILSIAEADENAGEPQPPVMYRIARAEAASTSIAAGEKDVTVTLNVRFLLQ